MSGSGGFAVSRAHGGDRFYNPPAIRRHQQLLLQQQQQQQQQLQRRHQHQQQRPRPVKSEAAVVEAENRTESDDSTATLSKPPSVCSSPTNVTNLDRLVESVTPSVPAQYFSEANVKGRARESDVHPYYYYLGDLWEHFTEWSVYGVGVPLLLNGQDSIIQYYVPYLSGIQLYVDPLKPPSRLRRPGEESDAESSRETSSGGSSDCEADRWVKGVADGSWSQQNLMNLNSQRMNRLSLREKSLMSSSSDEAETCKSPGKLLFEYLEQEQPHNRKPLTDKITVLASRFPELRMCRSCDLLPSSWISVAWYPIYRIPMGQSLRDLDASFLTFHSLSTHPQSISQPQFHGASGSKLHGGVDAASNISLPVFGLASYKLKGSFLSPSGPDECQQENSLLQAADNWLQRLRVILPDYQFFRSHYAQWR